MPLAASSELPPPDPQNEAATATAQHLGPAVDHTRGRLGLHAAVDVAIDAAGPQGLFDRRDQSRLYHPGIGYQQHGTAAEPQDFVDHGRRGVQAENGFARRIE